MKIEESYNLSVNVSVTVKTISVFIHDQLFILSPVQSVNSVHKCTYIMNFQKGIVHNELSKSYVAS